MVLIKPKRPVPPVPFLQAPIDEILNASTERSLIQVLEKFDSPYHFERPEERYLLNWHKVLNRFDELLDRYISHRNILSKPSTSKQHEKSAQRSTSFDNAKKDTAPQSALPVDFPLTPARQEPSGTSDVGSTPTKRDSDTDKKPLTFLPSSTLIRLVLRVTQRLIRNASHDSRNLYNSVEHLGALLADEHSAIVLLTLEILNMLMQRSHKLRSTRSHITYELSERLLDLATGWGGRENRLGLLECCSSINTDMLPRDGSRLYFEFTESKSSSSSPTSQNSDESPNRRERQPGSSPMENAGVKSVLQISPRNPAPIPLAVVGTASDVPPDGEPDVAKNGSLSAIVIGDVGAFRGTERWLLSTFALNRNVPKNKLFSLLCAFRRAKSFHEGREARVELAVLRLYALTTLFQLQPVPAKLDDLLTKEPELIQDLVAIASGSNREGLEDLPRCLRIIAIRCMTAMSTDRSRVGSIMSASGVSVHHGALPSLLRNEIAFLMSSSSDVQGAPDKTLTEEANLGDSAMYESFSIKAMAAKNRKVAGGLTLFNECNRVSAGVQRIHMTESLLALVHSLALAGGSSGATPLANSGVLAALIPLLTDADIRHARVVSQAIRAMQAIVEGSPQTLGCQLFRDHDGLALVAERIAFEVNVDDPDLSDQERDRNDEKVEASALQRRGESRVLYKRLGSRQMSPLEALEHPPPSASTASRGLLPHSKWALIRTLHQLLLRTLGNGGSEVRELVVGSKLPRALRKILAQPFLHGGNLFQSAANVTTEIAHAEPTATAELVKAGLASTVLRSISLGLPPCAEAVRCVPNLLAALCLAPTAKEVIVKAKPLKLYLLRLATPFYTRALHGETPVIIGSALDELMRHVEALRPDGNEAMIEYLRLSANFVQSGTISFDRTAASAPSHASNATAQKSDAAVKEKSVAPDKSGPSPGPPGPLRGEQEKNTPDCILLDRMKLAVANNSCRLVGFTQGSSEHQQGIVQKGGLDHIIQLRHAAALACAEASAREGNSVSRHYPTPAITVYSLVSALKTFSSRHYAAVLKSLFAVILKDAATVLEIAKKLNDLWLPEEDDGISSDSRMALDVTDPGSGRSSMSERPHLSADKSLGKSEADPMKSDGDRANESTVAAGKRAAKSDKGETTEARGDLRNKMSMALKNLRVGVVLLTRIPRGGSGTSPGVWETSRGAQVAAIVSTVERAARYHLAVVYTGLTLIGSSDGDLSVARVTAASDPELNPIRPEHCAESLGDLSKVFGFQVSTNAHFVEACKRYKVPPEGRAPVRQEVKGLAWCLVTFAVAAQRLYSVLSKALAYSSRRLSRDPSRYAASAKSLAATMGRIFALHLMAAVPLWDIKVVTMGRNRVVAAWDYVRGILIEIKGTLFDEGHRMTQSLILKSFLEAGGADALMQAARPFLIVQAASPVHASGSGGADRATLNDHLGLDKVLKNSSISVCSYILALRDALDRLPERKHAPITGKGSGAISKANEEEDSVMSSDSVSNQARAISRIVVSEADSRRDSQGETAVDDLATFDNVQSLLRNETMMKALEHRTARLRDIAFSHCQDEAIRRIASDVWNTLCGFLHLLAACPGLLSSGSSPVPGSAGLRNEWEARDTQRSAITVTLQLLTRVTSNPAELLAAFRPEGSAMSDILGIIHATTDVAGELGEVPARGSLADEAETFTGRQEERASAPRTSPDPDMLRSLVEMGFSERRAAYALRRTAPGGIEYATEWLVSHMEDGDDSPHSDGAEEPRLHITPDDEHENAEVDGDGDTGADVDGEDTNGERDDNSGERDDNNGERDGENESNDVGNEEADVAAGDAVQSAPIDSDGADQAMEDAAQMSAEARESEGSRVAEGSSRAAPPQGRRGRSSSRNKQKSHRLASSERKTGGITLNVGADQDAKQLLEAALRKELKLLTAALEKSKLVASSDIAAFRTSAAAHVGFSAAHGNVIDDESSKTPGVRITPTSVDAFTASKKQFFSTLLEVTRMVIRGCETHAHGRHLPYLAIELLSVLHKNGSLVHYGTLEFAALLDNGLRLALSEQLEGEQRPSGISGQTAAIWSHYGGNRARRALQSCGTFQLAYDCFVQTVGEWERSATGPLVDVEATQPIKELSITEEKRTDDTKTGGSVSKGSNSDRSQKLKRSRKAVLKPVTKSEAIWLRQLTTCLMLMDAAVRFESLDGVIESSKETEKGSGNGRDAKEAEKKESEKMDTDETPKESDTDNNSDRQSSDPGSMNITEARDALNEVIRNFFGTPSSAMEIDAKPAEDVEVDLDTVRTTAEENKRQLVTKAKKEIAGWISNKAGAKASAVFPKRPLLLTCITLLKLWQGLEVGDALLALLQLLVSLTREWDLAQAAIDGGLIEELLRSPHLESQQSRSTNFRVVRLLTKSILRHVLEDPETLREAMVAEIRLLFASSQGRSRPSYSVKTLISTTSPMAARDLQCFLSALTSTVKTSESDRRGDLQVLDYKVLSTTEIEAAVEKRPNVQRVISEICGLLADTRIGEVAGDGVDSRHSSPNVRSSGFELAIYALELLADFVEISQAAAVSFFKAPSPCPEVPGSTLDFIVQKVLPVPDREDGKNGSTKSFTRVSPVREEVSNAARKLFLALCSKTANTHEEAVAALAGAAKLEADKQDPSPNVIAGLAQCIAPGTKLRVLRIVLKTEFANDLARSLRGLDLSVDRNFDVASSVLRALSLIGPASTYLARYGDDSVDETPFGNSGSRDPFSSLRESYGRDEGLGHSGSFIVF